MSSGAEPGGSDGSPETDTVAFGETLVSLQGVTKHYINEGGLLSLTYDPDAEGFPLRTATERVQAVEDVSFDIRKGETFGLVGESGCGKSTLARVVLRLTKLTDGAVYYKGENLAELSGEELRKRRRDMQMIFQDPQSSLNPRMKVGPIVEEPMRTHMPFDAGERERRARELLQKVGLDPQHYNRYPHEFSGGQRQRVNLARALAVNPDFIVCDEPVSALDVSIQAQVLNTMKRLQKEFGLTYLFIAHDLSVIRHISDRVGVMYLGQLVEVAETQELFENPKHPYTKALLESIPIPDPTVAEKRTPLEGDVPNPIDPPSGCRFRTRCPQLILPAEYGLSETEAANIRTFMRAVTRHTFVPESRRAVETEFFDGAIPGGDAGEHVSMAIDLVVEGDWETAEQLLDEEFAQKSICAQEEPSYEVETVYGEGDHYAACHLYAEDGRQG